MKGWKSALVILLVILLCGTTVAPVQGAPTVPPKPTHFYVKDLRLQFRGPDVHPLGACERSPVRHFQVGGFYRNPATGRHTYLFNWHIGSHKNTANKTCYILWNSEGGTCLKTCNGKTGLQAIVEKALLGALVTAGIVVVGQVAIRAAVNLIIGPVLALPPYPL